MSVQLSEKAIVEARRRVKETLEELEQKGKRPEKLYLRIGVRGGGCAGLQYRLEFDTTSDIHDLVFKIQDITVVVDKKSYFYLNETTLDFIPGLQGGFIFQNPNEKSGCGCGISFSV